MDENLHDVDGVFKKGLDEHEDAPSPQVWQKLEANLNKKANTKTDRKKIWFRIAAALLLLILGTVIIETLRPKQAGKTLVASRLTKQDSLLLTIKKGGTKTSGQENNSSAIITTNSSQNGLNKKDKKQTAQNNNLVSSPIKNVQSAADNNLVTDNNKNKTFNFIKSANLQTALNNLDKERKTGRSRQKVKIISGDQQTVTAENNELENNVSSSSTQNEIPSRNGDIKTKFEKVFTEINSSSVNESDLVKNEIISSSHNLIPAEKNLVKKEGIAKESPEAVTKSVKSSNHTFSVAVIYSPKFSADHLVSDHHDFREDDRNAIKNQEQDIKSYTTGFLADYSFGKKWSIQSGITFSSSVTTIEQKTLYARYDRDGSLGYRFNCSTGYSYIAAKNNATVNFGDSAVALPSRQTVQFVNIPVAIQYTFGKNKFSFSPLVGFSANLLAKHSIETGIIANGVGQKQSNTISGIKTLSFTSLLSSEISYKIAPKVGISLIPSAQFALGSINKDGAVKSYPINFGIGGGLRFFF